MALKLPGLALLALLHLVPQIDGYSSGAPPSACSSMTPSHGGSATQQTPAPFQITPAGTVVDAGGAIQVTLSAVSPQTGFKGFLIQARDAESDAIVGSFRPSDYKLIDCSGGTSNAVTHKNSALKSSVVLQFLPPSEYAGDVIFKATAVQEFTRFWSGITSEKVTVRQSASGSPSGGAATATTTTSLSIVSFDDNEVEASNPGDVVIEVINPPETPPSRGGSGGPSPPSASPQTEISLGSPPSNSPPQFISVTSTPKVETTPPSTPAPSQDRTTRRGLLAGFRNRATPEPPRQSTTPRASTPARVSLEGLDAQTRRLVTAMDSIYLGCNANKGCFGMPAGCETKENCNSLFTYTKSGSDYIFEIMGNVPADGYIAGGLSFDENMGSDSVVACRSKGGLVDVTMTFNEGRSNSFLANQKEGIKDYQMAQENGKLYCQYTRVPKMEINGLVYDLDVDEFYLMVAKGALAGDGTLAYHDDRTVSGSPTSMSLFAALLVSSASLYVTLHASFMIAAWVGAASCGILLARYYKQTWRNYKACNIDQWFHWHRFFMILTWSLTIVAFVLMVVHLNGWTKVPVTTNPHAIIGIVSIGLCFIQPFMALLRCKPTDSRRAVFNWAHWFVGNSAQILGITAIFFGLELVGLPRWTWWIMIVYVGFHCLAHIFLSIGECVSDNKAKKRIAGQGKEFNSSRDALQPNEVLQDSPGATFRKAMLALYLLVIWLIVAVLIIIVAVGEDTLRDWGVPFWE